MANKDLLLFSQIGNSIQLNHVVMLKNIPFLFVIYIYIYIPGYLIAWFINMYHIIAVHVIKLSGYHV